MLAPIAILTPRYPPEIGGVERHVESLARGLLARGIPVEVLTTDSTGALPRVATVDGVPVRRFPTVVGEGRYFASPRLLRWVWQMASRYRLLHVHNYQSLVPLAGAIGAARAGRPLVVTTHYHAAGHTPLSALLHVPYRPVASWVLHSAASIIAVSMAERGWLERDFGDLPIHVVPSGVGLDEVAPDVPAATPLMRTPGEVTLLSVGRLEPYKGVEQIVTALPHLPPATHLVVIGVGPAARAITATAARLGVTDRVRLLGRVSTPDLAAWYSVTDLLVSLSREEAFGMTVLEAAGAGAPVLASAIPAHREVAGYVSAGRIALVDRDLQGDALARSITEALSMGRSTDRTGWRVPTWDSMVDGIIEVYAEVLGEPVI